MNVIFIATHLPRWLIVALLVLVLMPALAFGTSARASEPCGIRGKTAPELELEGWIEGDGNERTPLKLSDLRGKIV